MCTLNFKSILKSHLVIDFTFDNTIDLYFYIKKYYPNLKYTDVFSVRGVNISSNKSIIIKTNLIEVESACWREIKEVLFTGDDKKKLYIAALKYDAEYKDKDFLDKVNKFLDLITF